MIAASLKIFPRTPECPCVRADLAVEGEVAHGVKGAADPNLARRECLQDELIPIAITNIARSTEKCPLVTIPTHNSVDG